MRIVAIFFILVIVALAAFVVIYVVRGAIKRRKEIIALAERLGLRYYAEDPFDLPRRHGNMPAFSTGHSRRAYNTIHGTLGGCTVIVTDYTYTEGSGKNKQTFFKTYCLLNTGKSFRNLQVRPENFLDKVAAWVGLDDIDFEYKQFNDAYYVRSDDKKFAYDIINPKMMEYLLALRKIHFEMSGGVILAHFGRLLPAAEFEPLIRTAQGIYNLLPTYI